MLSSRCRTDAFASKRSPFIYELKAARLSTNRARPSPRAGCGCKDDIKEPMASGVGRRDDFASVVLLVQTIESDAAVVERLRERMKAMHEAANPPRKGEA